MAATPVSLVKGGNVSLSKEAPGIQNVIVGLGWDVNAAQGVEFDLDASCFLLGENGKVASNNDFIFYNNLKSADGSVVHNGDNRTGAGEGDDESITIDLAKLPASVKTVAVAATIHEADKRKQNFGQVRNAYIRVVDARDNREIARFDLTEDASTSTAMLFGELYRHNNEWKFRAVEQGFNDGLAPMAKGFGVDIA